MPDRFGKADADSLPSRDTLTDKHLRDGRSSRRSETSHNCQHPQRLTRAKTSYNPRVPFPTKSVIARYRTRHRRLVAHGFAGVSDGTHFVSAHDMSAARNDGFTLIELLLVVGLIAVLAATTAPSIAGGMRRFTLTSASQQVASTIRTARYQAVGRNMTVRVRFDHPGSGQYQILDASDADLGPAKWLLEGAAFSSVSGDIEIDPQGRVTALSGTMPATIVLAGPDADTRTISVSRSGRVELP